MQFGEIAINRTARRQPKSEPGVVANGHMLNNSKNKIISVVSPAGRYCSRFC